MRDNTRSSSKKSDASAVSSDSEDNNNGVQRSKSRKRTNSSLAKRLSFKEKKDTSTTSISRNNSSSQITLSGGDTSTYSLSDLKKEKKLNKTEILYSIQNEIIRINNRIDSLGKEVKSLKNDEKEAHITSSLHHQQQSDTTRKTTIPHFGERREGGLLKDHDSDSEIEERDCCSPFIDCIYKCI